MVNQDLSGPRHLHFGHKHLGFGQKYNKIERVSDIFRDYKFLPFIK